MRNKLYFYTENLNFFYLINKELNRFKIKFEILNFGDKIPDIACVIITTAEELDKVKISMGKNVVVVSYAKNDNFNQYILKLIAVHRIGYKKSYSDLTFSIDPGTKHIGLVIFLDDYFLNSHTLYETNNLIKKINDYIDFLQITNPNLINLNFKFGRGVLQMTKELVKTVFNKFRNRGNLKIYLIDEAKSSINLFSHRKKRRIPKDEVSALILALRDGIEVNQYNYRQVFNQIKNKKLNKENFENSNDIIKELGEIAEEILNGRFSLNEAIEILKDIKLHKC